jgi:AraC family transcriptional regulator of arabinose operon
MAPHEPDMSRPWSIGLLVHDLANPPGATCRATVAHWVVGLTLAGSARYHGPHGATMDLDPGDISLVRVRVPQSWEVTSAGTPWRVVYAVFDPRPHWLPWLDWEECMPGHARLRLGTGTLFTAITAAFQRAFAAWNSGRPDATDRTYHAVEEVLLGCQEHRRGLAATDRDRRVDAALELLAGDLAADLPLRRLAARVGLSRTQLAHLFRRQVGMGPMAWRAQQRLAQAQQLLRAPFLSVKQVAAMTGFRDAKYFSTAFRRHTGVSPQAFRGRA